MAALFLLHPRQGFDRTPQSMSSLIMLTFTIVVSTVLVAVGFIWHRGGVWCAANGGVRPGSGDLLGGAHDRHHGDDAVCPDAVNKARCCVDVAGVQNEVKCGMKARVTSLHRCNRLICPGYFNLAAKVKIR